MPGKDYGHAGKWVHDRAHRIMKDSPETPKHIAYATAVMQGHKVGKTPKDFRTAQGVREAKKKYDAPKSEYQKTAAKVLAKYANGEGDEVALGKKVPREALLQFFKDNPSPTDEKVHELAEAYGTDPHTMETQIYAILGEKLQKQKTAGGGAALGAESLGIPGAALAGYLEKGRRGAIGAGAGSLLGLGGGVLASHLMKKHLISPEFASRHPLLTASMAAVPMAIGGAVGGEVGSHMVRHASIDFSNSSILSAFFDELEKIGSIGAGVARSVKGEIDIARAAAEAAQRARQMRMAKPIALARHGAVLRSSAKKPMVQQPGLLSRLFGGAPAPVGA